MEAGSISVAAAAIFKAFIKTKSSSRSKPWKKTTGLSITVHYSNIIKNPQGGSEPRLSAWGHRRCFIEAETYPAGALRHYVWAFGVAKKHRPGALRGQENPAGARRIRRTRRIPQTRNTSVPRSVLAAGAARTERGGNLNGAEGGVSGGLPFLLIFVNENC